MCGRLMKAAFDHNVTFLYDESNGYFRPSLKRALFIKLKVFPKFKSINQSILYVIYIPEAICFFIQICDTVPFIKIISVYPTLLGKN